MRLANPGAWDAGRGDNLLTASLPIDPDAPGQADPAAAGFAEIP